MIYIALLMLALLNVYQACRIDILNKKVNAAENDIAFLEKNNNNIIECLEDLKDIYADTYELLQKKKNEHKDD